MKLRLLSLFSLVAAEAAFAASGFDPVAFSPEKWPGKAPAEVTRRLQPLGAEFLQAMRAHDAGKLMQTRERIVAALGSYCGVPEERPVYGLPIDASPASAERVGAQWRVALQSLAGRYGWEQAKALETSPGAGGRVPRLRVSERQIRALLQTHEAGLDPTGEYRRLAIAGLDYLLTAQTSGGAFGYPYEPDGAGLRQEAAQTVQKGEKQGLKMVERGWVIEDLGAGGLNFDNGVCGAVLLQGYAITGDRRYLDAAVRAGHWAKSRPLALNFNYNGFSGLLLTRLYRVTGDRSWLEAARKIFEFGVLSGEMPNGRWFDQHNAKIQYHAILCSQTIEYLQALRLAKDESAARVEDQARRALDNLAAEIATYGTNNAEEALSLAALSFGLLVLGPDPAWEKAATIAINYLTGPFPELLKSRGRSGLLPEPVACWLLLQAVKERKLTPSELRDTIAPPAKS